MKYINWIKGNYLLLIIFFVAAVLRMYHADYQSLWLDEIVTINITNPNASLGEAYNTIAQGDGPPLYFLIVHIVFKIFGYTTFVLRMVSVVFGLAGILSIYFLGKEIFNKKVGIYSCIILSVNYFHIYYSQEARVYSFFFFVTIISFYTLIRFIKVPTLKSAILYGIFASVMLYGHYFALFTLISQYLIILFFIIWPFNISRVKFFFYSFFSGIITLILYLPLNYKALIGVNNITHFWAPKPGLDVYTQIFKDLFGQSEIVLFFIIILFFVYFMQLFKVKDNKNFNINPNEEKFVFGFLILFTWILITLLLPLIRAYTNVPNLISRYFMAILPAIILVVSVGLYYVRNIVVRYLIILFIIIFSLTDIIIVKKYYINPTKDQFREVCEFISKNNTNSDPVISNRSWFLTYYFRERKYKLVDKTLEEFVNEMIEDSTKRHSFWYAGAGDEVSKISKKTQTYLDDHFEIENNADFHCLWTKHYSSITNPTPEIDISKYFPLKEKSGDEFQFFIDNFQCSGSELKVEGFAFFKDLDASESVIELIMVGDKKAFKIQNQKVVRKDVTTYFKSVNDLSNSGFKINLLSNNLLPGKYQFGIILKNKVNQKEGMVLCNNFYIKE